MKKWNRKLALILTLVSVLVLVLGLTGCKGKSDPAAVPADPAATEAAEKASKEENVEKEEYTPQEENTPKEESGSVAEEGEKGSGSAAEEGEKESGQAAEPGEHTGLRPIHIKVETEYLSEWIDDSPALLTNTSQVLVLSEGYDKLKETLSAMNEDWYGQMKAIYDNNLELVREITGEGRPSNFDYSLTATPVRSDEVIVSLREEEYSYLGGAHPNTFLVGHNLDPSTGEEFSLHDVVTDYDRFFQTVGSRLKEDYPADSFFDNYEDTLRAMFYERSDLYGKVQWTMDREGVTVHFNTYDLGPYAAGPFEVRFEFKEDPDLFVKRFQYEGNAAAKWVNPHMGCMADVDGDGTMEQILFQTIESDQDFMTKMTIKCGDHSYETEFYGQLSDVYFMRREDGSSYLYTERKEDNDYRYMEVFSLKKNGIAPVGSLFEAPYDVPVLSPDEFLLYDRMDTLGTYMAYRKYHIGENGMPEADDPVYETEFTTGGRDYIITTLVDLPVLIHDNAAEEPHMETLPAGTNLHIRRTDNDTFVEMELDDGRRCDISVDRSQYPAKVNGVSEWDCFDGLFYAG